MLKDKQQEQNRRAAALGKLLARPMQPQQKSTTVGLQSLGLDSERDALLYVPKSYQADKPAPLIVMLHGAGGDARGGLTPFLHQADDAGLILLAPASRLKTWDMLYGEYGADIAFINQALMQTFNRYAVDPAHIAVEGFSDGASYALSVGITNGDLFSHIIAFSPGFMAPQMQQGKPQIFISHGTWDNVLPIKRCSCKIVPQLQRADYDVVYQEFHGFHTVPTEIANSALKWFGK
ncbi:MAG: phospholipase [Mojavia pulchra JT2-VF2]|jgi:predicted esterase|uniref:Phospholipase n=1 Tax=Mojavia pulchra JT2-VF2 TaxID=287848 RepID=A0A951Q457_9NOST|nr:phospholipase [Mojavia pulchra JT2-VF2]